MDRRNNNNAKVWPADGTENEDIFKETDFGNEDNLLGERSSHFEPDLDSYGDDGGAFAEFEFNQAGSLLKSRKGQLRGKPHTPPKREQKGQ
ncbi:unnamed protein product, partial [Pylaiella littoralis]